MMIMVKQMGDYYLGLDIGTSSVGWAVTDTDYNILEYRRKAMWGIHLFDEGSTATERRLHRCARRRLSRRKQRIALLRERTARAKAFESVVKLEGARSRSCVCLLVSWIMIYATSEIPECGHS